MSIPVSGTSPVLFKLVEETGISMSYGDLTDSDGRPGGRIFAWATWFRLHAFATGRGTFLGPTSENGVWVLARRTVIVLFAMIWLPAGIYVSFAYVDVQYVPPVFFDELESSGREPAAQTEKMSNGSKPISSIKLEWRRVPGGIEVIVPADGLEAARKLGEGALIARLRRSSPSLRAVFTRQSHDHVSAERHLALPGGRRRGDADRAPAPAARNSSVGSQSCNLPALSRR